MNEGLDLRCVLAKVCIHARKYMSCTLACMGSVGGGEGMGDRGNAVGPEKKLVAEGAALSS